MGLSYSLADTRAAGGVDDLPSREIEVELGRVQKSLKWDEIKLRPSIGVGRSGVAAAVPLPQSIKVNSDDVVTLKIQNGPKLMLSGDRFFELFAEGQQGAYVDANGELVLHVPHQLPSSLRQAATARGLESEIENVVVSKLSAVAGRISAPQLCKWYEDRCLGVLHREAVGGLLKWNGSAFSKPTVPVGVADAASLQQPILLFLHGTGSNTRGAFGHLQQQHPQQFKRLIKKYETVYAFEHRTLTVSPIKNAIKLVHELPDGATLHVVSHSRGGLVGELLCRSGRVDDQGRPHEPFDEIDRDIVSALADPAVLAEQLHDLNELNDLLKTKKLKIDRFVRVACPALGTTLVSKRLDFWLSILFELAGLIEFINPVAGQSIDWLGDFAKALISQRTDASVLPGLASMAPGGPLVRILNRDDVLSTDDLSVIAGDSEDMNWNWKALEWITDKFFDGPNDLVVNTGSMYGGMKRVRVIKEQHTRSNKVVHNVGSYCLESGSDVRHTTYFYNESSVRKLVQRLTERERYSLTVDFKTLTPNLAEEPARSAAVKLWSGKQSLPIHDRVSGVKPIVVVLPGIMGSELSLEQTPIWARPVKLMFGGLSKLQINAEHVTADNLLPDPYDDLCQYLSQTHDVIRFPYDWRRSVIEAAEKLKDRLTPIVETAERSNQPIRFIAHSMGGLVLGALIASQPGIWNRIRNHSESRAILLGTPLEGSWSIIQLLCGKEPILNRVALIDFKSDVDELVQVVRSFPGALELLPHDRILNPSRDTSHEHWGTGTAFDEAVWDHWAMQLGANAKTKLVRPDARQLRNAREVNQLLRRIDWREQGVFYISGRAERTPIGLRIVPESDKTVIQFAVTPDGDGRVAWNLDTLNSINRWYMDADHGELANYSPKFGAILELLQSGRTTQLTQSRSTLSRSAGALCLEYQSDLDRTEILFPTRQSLALVAVGSQRDQRAPQSTHGRTRLIRVSVLHGDLTFARFPVAVGHYDGDPLVGPELKLDQVFERRLTTRQTWGMYAGRVGTSEIVMARNGQRPKGAIIVGLGRAGELTLAQLQQSFMMAVLNYATSIAAQSGGPDADARKQTCKISLSTLLIGTSSDGLQVSESIEAILRAVLEASERLHRNGYGPFAPNVSPFEIEELEFVELYDDHAATADRCLRELIERPPFATAFSYEDMQFTSGNQQRENFNEAPGWWHRLRITRNNSGVLKFDMLTRRARTETHELQTQSAVLDLLTREATASTITRHEICRTLFQMLLPNPLKEAAAWNNLLQLILDTKAAALPWEMLWDRNLQQPPVVSSGMLRQLQTTNFRPKPIETFERLACVIGDPIGTDGKPIDGFLPLEGAQREAAVVTDVLRQNGYQVRDVIRQSFIEVFNALFERGYRILHLAGHGVHEFSKATPEVDVAKLGLTAEFLSCIMNCREKLIDKPVSGMVLGRINKSLAVLGAADVEQMLSVPELVFINCCELGRTQPGSDSDALRLKNPPAYAANIAEQFIRMGVRCVIAAGWEIDDAAASTFAEVFYQAFLKGETFGNSVRRAREETWLRHPNVNTWGAYQCYGDPGWRLVTPRELLANEIQRLPKWVTPKEALVGLQNYLQRAKATTVSTASQLMSELQAIRSELQSERSAWHKWSRRADILGALGIAFSEAGDFETSVELLQKAIKSNEGHPAPAITQERLCDALNRLAFEVVDDSQLKERCEISRQQTQASLKVGNNSKSTATARLDEQLLTESLVRLQRLLQLSENSELYQLLSSTLRRRAAQCSMDVTGELQCREWLKRAILASNAALRLEKREEDVGLREPGYKWEDTSWPEYTLQTLMTLLVILDPGSASISKAWLPKLRKDVIEEELLELARQRKEIAVKRSGNAINKKNTAASSNSLPMTDALVEGFQKTTLLSWCDALSVESKQNGERRPTFWNSTWQGGCDLLRLLLELVPDTTTNAKVIASVSSVSEPFEKRADKLLAGVKTGYENAGNLGGSGRERNSLIQHLQCVVKILKIAEARHVREAIATNQPAPVTQHLGRVISRIDELILDFKSKWQ